VKRTFPWCAQGTVVSSKENDRHNAPTVAVHPDPAETVSYIAATALVALIALVGTVLSRRRTRKPAAPDGEARPTNARPRFDTTIGEFHELRDALRPLEHTRAASKTLPQGRR